MHLPVPTAKTHGRHCVSLKSAICFPAATEASKDAFCLLLSVYPGRCPIMTPNLPHTFLTTTGIRRTTDDFCLRPASPNHVYTGRMTTTVHALEDLERIHQASQVSFGSVLCDHLSSMRKGGLFPESDGLPRPKLLPAASFARRRSISDCGPSPAPLPTVNGGDVVEGEEVLAEAWSYAQVSAHAYDDMMI